MRFFFDNCISLRIAEAIERLTNPECEVTHLQQKFPSEVTDPEWLGTLGDEGGWIIVSGDERIVKNPQNQRAWRQSGLTAFFLKSGWTNFKLWDQAWRLVKYWPSIVEAAARAQPGIGYWVSVNGKLEPVRFK